MPCQDMICHCTKHTIAQHHLQLHRQTLSNSKESNSLLRGGVGIGGGGGGGDGGSVGHGKE